MVSFQTISNALSQNTHAAFQVATHRVRPQPIVGSFKLPAIRIAPATIPVQKKPRIPSPVRSETSEEAFPPPTRMMPVAIPLSPTPPSPPTPHILPTVSAPPTPQARQSRVKWVDPICLGIEHTDPMYSIATTNVQRSLECEEARRLEARIGELYKEESGRSRGWVKGKLEAFFLPRAAVGSRVSAKDTFDWEKVWTDKEASAILDYVCLAKGIRLAVWKENTIGLWPAADASASKGGETRMIHVGNVGTGIRQAMEQGWKLRAPMSVEHGLEKLTLDELDGLAEKMGITIPSGKKTEKVQALATARMAMRIC